MPMIYGYGYGWEGVLIAAAIWVFTRWQAGRTPSSSAAEPSAAEILRQRYARGEIDTATYEEMRQHLDATDESLAGVQPPAHV